MGRTIFIGDVHGCGDELADLLNMVAPGSDGSRVVFVGDLVDKGPRSLDTLRLARWVVENHSGSVVVAGNHEEKALRMFKSGKLDQFVDGHEHRAWVHDATDEDWAFIESMPLTWHDPEANIRVVHGGIFPALLEKHPDAFDKIEARGAAWHKGGGKVMNRARRMLRVRFVDQESGDMLALGENKPGDPFWADTYDGSQGLVIFGHSPFLNGKARVFQHAIGIDTGCVFGGKLTALVIDSEDKDERGHFIQVDARRQHAIPLKED